MLREDEVVDEPEYLTDAFVREAAVFVENHAQEPFFLYLPFNAVHSPLEATNTYLGRFPGIADPKGRTYAAMTTALDDAVGRVLTKLREHSLGEDTLILFLSDNGGPTPETTSSDLPLRGYKGQTYEGGIRIPYMLQWKGRLPAGRVSAQPVIALDIHPPVVAAIGESVDPAWQLDGVNLLPYLAGEQASRWDGSDWSASATAFGRAHTRRTLHFRYVPSRSAPGHVEVTSGSDAAASRPMHTPHWRGVGK